MLPMVWTAGWSRLSPWERSAVVLWTIMVVAVCVRCAVQPQRQSVFPVWKGAGHDWFSGHDLYDESASADPIRFGYRYCPLLAGMFTVCDIVPERLGNVLFRLGNVGIFFVAVSWWLRAGVPWETTPGQRGLVCLLLAPVALGSLNNAQVNLLLIALMLLCVTAICQERWNLAACCAALAFWLKLYPLALALLVGMLFPRRFLPRFLVAVALFGVLPFVMQSPEYVLRQYQLWWERISHNDAYRRFWPLEATYRDVYLLLRVWNVPISPRQYTILQLFFAGLTGLLTALSWWRLGKSKEVLFAVLSLSVAWMLVLGPAPESCTYILIGPMLAWWLVQSRVRQLDVGHYVSVFAYGLMLLCVVTGTSLRGIQLYHAPGLQPLAVLIFAAGFTWTLLGRLWEAKRLEMAEPGMGVGLKAVALAWRGQAAQVAEKNLEKQETIACQAVAREESVI